ncbi:MAG: lipopolysaccharide biosynthesis protein [Candidatus Eiseniibacteriota bacterium]
MKPGEIAHSVSRGAFYLAVERVAALLSGTLYFALLLRWMGPTKYGIVTLALSFVGLASMATGNFEMYLERYAAEHEAHGRFLTLRRAHRLALALKLGLGVLAGAILSLLAPLLAHHFDSPELGAIVPVVAFIVACDGLSTTGRAVLYGLQRFRLICAVSVAFHVAKTVMVGTLWWAQKGLVELAVGLAVITALQGLVQTVAPMWMLRHARDPAAGADEGPPLAGGLLRAMMAYCTPLLGARVAFLSGQNLSKVVLGKLVGLAELGFFSFAFQTVERFVELAHTLPAALLPSLTKLVATGERDRLRWVFDQAFRLIQAGACALSLGLFLFAPELTRWVASPMFVPAVPLLQIMALVPLARTAQQPFTMVFQALRLPGTVLTLTLIKVAVEFSCYFALVPALRLAGAGWANLAGATIAFAGAHFALRRTLPEGSGARARASLLGLVLVVPLLAAGLAIDAALDGAAAAACKLLLAPLAVAGAFALGLVTPYDLEKVSSLPLSAAWMRRMRDAAVAVGDRLARVVALRRSP